jgi:hypothetical protein
VLLRGDFTKNYSSTVQVYGGIREILLFHRQPVSLKHINIKELHCRQPRYEKRMPPRRNRQPPAHNLSWFSAHHHWVTIRSVLEIDTHNRRLLERFRHHARVHTIPYFHSSHQVFDLGPHLRQYFRTSLRSLLTLDYVPRKVKIPTSHVPHDCRFYPEVSPLGSPLGSIHQRPFKYILAISRLRGRPCRKTVLLVSSDELESESDTDDSGMNSGTDDSSGISISS